MPMSPKARTNLILAVVATVMMLGALGGLLVAIHGDHARGKGASAGGIVAVVGVTVLAVVVTITLSRRRTLRLFNSAEVEAWHTTKGTLSREQKRMVMRGVRRGETVPAELQPAARSFAALVQRLSDENQLNGWRRWVAVLLALGVGGNVVAAVLSHNHGRYVLAAIANGYLLLSLVLMARVLRRRSQRAATAVSKHS